MKDKISLITAWQKVMTQNFNDPYRKRVKGRAEEPFFTHRTKTGLYSKTALSLITPLKRLQVQYNEDFWASMPFVSWFYSSSDIDVNTYESEMGSSEVYYDDNNP
mmetsp:Transcript_24985/g.31196  ORF Transcript_24985/g.31196 Transcript_24985/m.31196 type:complete len:105 (+) Transcript_24985:742-1056(+)